MENILICNGHGKLLINPKSGDVAWADSYYLENHLRKHGYILMEIITAMLNVYPNVLPIHPCDHCRNYVQSIRRCRFVNIENDIEDAEDMDDMDINEYNEADVLGCVAVDKHATYTTVMTALRATGRVTQELILSIASPKEMSYRLRHSVEYNLCNESKDIFGKLPCKGEGILMIHPEDGDIVFLTESDHNHIWYKEEGYIPIDVIKSLYNVEPITFPLKFELCDKCTRCFDFFVSFGDKLLEEPDDKNCIIVDLKATSELMMAVIKKTRIGAILYNRG